MQPLDFVNENLFKVEVRLQMKRYKYNIYDLCLADLQADQLTGRVGPNTGLSCQLDTFVAYYFAKKMC